MREGDEGRKDPTGSWGGISGVCVGGSLGHPEAVLCPLCWALWCWRSEGTQTTETRRKSFGSHSCDFPCVLEKACGTWGNRFLRLMLQKWASWGQMCFHALFIEEGV